MSLPESAFRYYIDCTMGDTRVLTLILRQSAGPVVDCTGMSANLTFSDRATGAVLATLSTVNAGIAPLDATGVIAIDRGHAAYVALPAGAYAYRLDTIEAGRTRPLMRGVWRIVA